MSDDSKLSPEDLPIIIALCIRHEKAWAARDIAKAEKERAEARLIEAQADVNKIRKAIAAFDVDMRESGWFGPIRDAVGPARFDKALRDAGLDWVWDDDEPPIVRDDAQLEAVPAEALPSTASIRDLVLERLKLAGTKGTLAAPVRESIEYLRKTTLHDKTIGMTLYRLSREGFARREGRNWFFVQEAKNPGGGTPGLINRDNKEGEEP